MKNTEKGGLTSTPPDVKQNIASARTAFAGKKYGEAKFAVKQALLGVELEIGQNLLKSLPDKVDGLPKVPEEDQVKSSGAGFIGLQIDRVFRDDKKELALNILNDANISMGINMYLNNPGYSSQGNSEGKKTVMFKGNKGLLEFNEDEGYTLHVPIGQTSLFIVKGVNYKSEADFMNAANQFDIQKIKTELGEK